MARLAPVALALLLVATPVAAEEVPFLSGRVVDEADVIPDDAQARVEQALADFEQKTGTQIAVLTVESLDGEVLEEYALKVAETWKIGRAGNDDGAVFLVAEQDRKMRIEVGYGLEPDLTDIESKMILDEVVRPHFRNGDFGGGIEAGATAIVAALEGRPIEPAAEPQSGFGDAPLGFRLLFVLIFVVVIGSFSLVALSSSGCQSWFLYLFLMPFYLLFPMAISPAVGIGALALWAVAFPLLKLTLGRRPADKRPRWLGPGGWGGMGPIVWGGGGSGGGWRSGGGGWSGGGGGFSGGGGSFGGGGASGSW